MLLDIRVKAAYRFPQKSAAVDAEKSSVLI